MGCFVGRDLLIETTYYLFVLHFRPDERLCGGCDACIRGILAGYPRYDPPIRKLSAMLRLRLGVKVDSPDWNLHLLGIAKP